MSLIKFRLHGCSSCGAFGAVAARVGAKNQRTEDESGVDIAAV